MHVYTYVYMYVYQSFLSNFHDIMYMFFFLWYIVFLLWYPRYSMLNQFLPFNIHHSNFVQLYTCSSFLPWQDCYTCVCVYHFLLSNSHRFFLLFRLWCVLNLLWCTWWDADSFPMMISCTLVLPVHVYVYHPCVVFFCFFVIFARSWQYSCCDDEFLEYST